MLAALENRDFGKWQNALQEILRNCQRQDAQLQATIAQKNHLVKDRFLAKSVVMMYRKENERLKTRISNLEKQMSKRSNSSKASKNENALLKQEINELKDRIKMLRKRKSRNNQSKLLKASQEKILEYELKIIDDKLLIEKLKARLKTQQNQLKRKGRSLPSSPFSPKAFESPKEAKSAKKTRTAAKLTQEVLHLETDNNNLKEQIDRIRTSPDIVIPEEFSLARKENEKLVNRNLELEGELNASKRELNFEDVEEEPDPKKEELVDLEKEVIYLTNIVNSPMKFPQINTDFDEVHEELSVPDQIRLATKKLESLAEEEKRKQTEMENLVEYGKQKEEELETLEADGARKTDEISKLRVAIEAIEANKIDLQNQLKEMQNTIDEKDQKYRQVAAAARAKSMAQRAKRGIWIKKWCRNKKEAFRKLRIDVESSRFILEGGKKPAEFNLDNIISVEAGISRFPKRIKGANVETCFTVRMKDRDLNLQSGSLYERDEWVHHLQTLS